MPAGRGPRATTRANPAGLTERQLDVLELLSEGLTNAQIAERLVLSVRTVDHHVAAVLDKLGVPSRHEAAGAARRLGVGAAAVHSPLSPSGASTNSRSPRWVTARLRSPPMRRAKARANSASARSATRIRWRSSVTEPPNSRAAAS